MSAATAVTMFVVMSTTATIVTAFAFAMMMTTTMTATSQHFDSLADLFLCGIAILDDGTCEVECLASQRVVGVDSHAVFFDLHDLGHELMVFAICQGDDGIGVDVIVVEMTIDREYLTVDLVNALRFVGAKGLLRREDKVESIALRMLGYLLLEGVEGNAKTSNKLEWALCACLFLEFLLAISHGIQFVYH